jgi:hypothetical protein
MNKKTLIEIEVTMLFIVFVISCFYDVENAKMTFICMALLSIAQSLIQIKNKP